jgi:flavin reductase (DIM6/NTAB) family NADH-FMN oxidoreductase RutF
VAFVDCEVERVVETGDHVLVLGRVLDMGVETGQIPLLHHRSGYRSVAGNFDREAGGSRGWPSQA